MTSLPTASNYTQIQMSDKVFNQLSEFIYSNYGIKMPLHKKIMLQSRLQRRLRHLNMSSFDDYVSFVFSNEGEKKELVHMTDLVTTNKTDFFREQVHFDFLTQYGLPELLSYRSAYSDLKIWSAGCSSGEEPYSIAIMMQEFSNNVKPLNYNIFAVDLSTEVLQSANNAIYKEEKIEGLPLQLKKKYFLRSKEGDNKLVRVKKEIRDRVHFSRMNLIKDIPNVKQSFDIIFCRNTLIYFDRDTQESVINNLSTKLNQGGFFFLGHSESIANMKVPLKHIKPTIFQKI